MEHAYFSTLLSELSERSRSAVLSRLGFVNPPLYRHLEELFSRPLGAPGSLLADPTFEATFGWEESPDTMSDLEGGLLSKALVDALDRPPEELREDYRFGREYHPYRHQKEAWETLSEPTPQSLIVTSGTGSGKTECFMLPILDRLLREANQSNRQLVGVRALLLYPLNALINSQRERLRAWTHSAGDRVRFCLYNGTTEERLPTRERNRHPNVVVDRETLRETPPPILVTNATMLEYMLVRTVDAPILQQSQGRLEWVVLDEAHSYIGSQAAEIALLIRRVLQAFGVEPSQVRFVATSATIGDPKGEAGDRLKDFLADVAGVDPDRVHLVAGSRRVPSLRPARGAEPLDFDGICALDSDKGEDQPNPQRFAALAEQPTSVAIRRLFLDSGAEGTRVVRLSEVCATVSPAKDPPDAATQREALRWLDLLHRTRDGAGDPFLPLRAHLFHQTLSGLWACADPTCAERPERLRDPDWPFGRVYLEPRKHCVCGAPVYELAACDDCGAAHLLAANRRQTLLPPLPRAAVDEFELDMEPVEPLDDEQEDEEWRSSAERQVLVVNRGVQGGTGEVFVEKTSRRFADRFDPEATVRLHIQEDDGGGLFCPQCTARSRGRRQFQPARIGAPFLLSVILPTLLEFAPDGPDPRAHPHRGRRLLTFNDSRQGTARMAARLQQESERNRVRGLVYHIALRDGRRRAGADAEQLRDDIRQDESFRPHIRPEGLRAFEERLGKKRERLAKLEQPIPVPFDDMARELAKQKDFERMLAHYHDDVSRETFGGPQGPLELARMFLIREFGRRPKRLNNLESMGLVAVRYPALEKLTDTIEGFTLEESRDLLKIGLDFFVRAGGSLEITRECRHWLGMPFPQTSLVERDRDAVDRYERRWPRAHRSGPKNLLIRLLSHILQVGIDTPDGEDRVDSVLDAMWRALRCIEILTFSADGRAVLNPRQLAFAPITNAWVCPVTRRFLDTTLRSVTPYLPMAGDGRRECESVQLPLYETPFGGDAGDVQHVRDARRWLRTQDEIEALRRQGLWTVVNDRAIELAPYFVAGEHSAQQTSERLQHYEKAFRDGDLNLLSCSTTMEMGIDIGGIALVAMNNVPPHPANYLQRAGRAGRRRESHSLALTLCKSNPHDQIVFANTDWPFVKPLPAPMVSLDSEVLVQRHVNALTLSHFLREVIAAGGQDASKLLCEWFFVASGTASNAERFVAWCGEQAAKTSGLSEGLRHLVSRSLFEGTGTGLLLRGTGDTMQAVTESWLAEWSALGEQEREARANGESDPAYKAIGYQKRRMGGEYLLRELAAQGFLPAYGFPTHIAAFDNLTLSRFKRLKREQEEKKGREDNRFRRRELANRDSTTALREYAPGAQVVMDGLVYRSAGITLNWKAPASEEEAREPQAIQHAWRCPSCGASGWERLWQPSYHCTDCGATIEPKRDSQSRRDVLRPFLAPAGFSVDFYHEPTNDVTTQDFIPVEEAWVSACGPWSSLPNPGLGRFRTTTRGSIFHQSNGLHGEGYALCLRCGRAAPMEPDNRAPAIFEEGKSHYPLRGSKAGKSGKATEPCPGNVSEPWAIQQGISLGDARYTDVLEVQLKTLSGLWLDDRVTAKTLAVAMRDTLADFLGVQAQELGCAIKPVRPDPDENSACQSILIYDHFAAGYASSAGRFIGQMFHRVQERLQCTADCDSACPHCVLDFDQRFDADSLDRHKALGFLDAQWLSAYRLPKAHEFFGPDSQCESMPLADAILREARRPQCDSVRLFASGPAQEADLGPSPWRHLAYRVAGIETNVELVIDEATLGDMDPDDRHLLASLADQPRVRVTISTEVCRTGAGWVIAECLSSDSATRWAVGDASPLIPNPGWGTFIPCVIIHRAVPCALVGKVVAADRLRPGSLSAEDREIEIHHELDGPLNGFGDRFWGLLASRHAPLQSLLFASGDPVAQVEYHDRYLFNPLSVAILIDLLDSLARRVGTNRWPAPEAKVTTTRDRPPYRRQSPVRVWEDWPKLELRDTILSDGLLLRGIEAKLTIARKQRTAHGRLLVIQLESGKRVRIRLDQGVSYWRLNQARTGPGLLFDFDSDPAEQAEAVAGMSIEIQASIQPTQVFVSIR